MNFEGAYKIELDAVWYDDAGRHYEGVKTVFSQVPAWMLDWEDAEELLFEEDMRCQLAEIRWPVPRPKFRKIVA